MFHQTGQQGNNRREKCRVYYLYYLYYTVRVSVVKEQWLQSMESDDTHNVHDPQESANRDADIADNNINKQHRLKHSTGLFLLGLQSASPECSQTNTTGCAHTHTRTRTHIHIHLHMLHMLHMPYLSLPVPANNHHGLQKALARPRTNMSMLF